ncbi:MAG: hypothetical protein D3914_14315 [Candidatus Electrothrix sp. LOE2]|nr:hypothetical protein [Candidatus Electrothrix sp. LOE2]
MHFPVPYHVIDAAGEGERPDKFRSGKRRKIILYPGQQMRKNGTEAIQSLNICRICGNVRKPFR